MLKLGWHNQPSSQQDGGASELLSDALDGNASVIRPLIYVIIVYIAVLFVVLGFISTSRDNEISSVETARFEHFVEGHLNYLTEVMGFVATLASSDLQSEDKSLNSADTLLAHLSKRRLANQMFVFSPKGELLSEKTWRTDTAHADADQITASTRAMLTISTYTGKPVSDILNIDGDLFVVTVSAFPCKNYHQDCAAALVERLETSVNGLMDRFWFIEGFQVANTKPSTPSLSSAPVRNLAGETVGWFQWVAWRPGRSLLFQIAPWLSLVTAGVIAVAWHVWRRGLKLSSQLQLRQKEAHHKALHDPLTGLANRSLLTARIDEALHTLSRSGKGFALHLIDLDRFKTVNDTLGHQAGDELLIQAAARLKSVCRSGDTIARLGGDEFALIQLDVSNPTAAARLARRATEQLANVYKIGETDVFISGSIGVSVTNTQSATIDELLRQADIALYRAKGLGRNQFCFFESEMDKALQERSAIEKDLRAALEKGELNVLFQPQVSADGRHVRGMEALVRWNHAKRGVVTPSVFVPVAEETGLIRQLGEFVMQRSLQVARNWPDITMAVNVSAGELNHQDYATRVIEMVKESGVSPDQIELEITETVLLENSARVTRNIKQLKAAGLRIALDDFGTGYSSLSYLRRHQVDKLKIDQSFVSSIGVRDDAGAVVQAIIQLGEALGLSVTAEGVETETQRAALRARGCAYLQGYLFSRPIEASQIGELIKLINQNGSRGVA